jgi:integrase
MDFLTIVNKRLDHIKAYNSSSHYRDALFLARQWLKKWKGLKCSEITTDIIEGFMIKKSRSSLYTANQALRHLRALYNFGIKRKWLTENPTNGIAFLPIEKNIKYIPPKEDVLAVILAAEPEDQVYLWVFKETMGRMNEINRITWSDVNFKERYVILYTRKKRGGHMTPRKVPMTQKLFDVLSRKYEQRDKTKPWVFWHRHWDKKQKMWVEGPYRERKNLMKDLCEKAGVRYFRYHAFRHFGASTLDNANVNIGSIQRILGHENRTTTEIYLHSIGEAEREAMNVFERITENPHTNPHTISTKENRDSAGIAKSP